MKINKYKKQNVLNINPLFDDLYREIKKQINVINQNNIYKQKLLNLPPKK